MDYESLFKLSCTYIKMISQDIIKKASFHHIITTKKDVIFEDDTGQDKVYVTQKDGYRSLKFTHPNGLTQSTYKLDNPEEPVFDYVYYSIMALLYSKPNPKILMIGLGGGSIIRLFKHIMPKVKIDVVDQNKAVAIACKKYFGIDKSKANIIVNEGRSFLNKSKDKWDIIILDVYNGNFIPPKLSTVEFIELVKDHLNHNGVFAWNIWQSKAKAHTAMVNTTSEVFSHVDVYNCKNYKNSIVIGTDHQVKEKELLSRAEKLHIDLDVDLDDIIKSKVKHQKNGGQIITDDNLSTIKDIFE